VVGSMYGSGTVRLVHDPGPVRNRNLHRQWNLGRRRLANCDSVIG
jgi:hypothetical protein